MVAVTQEAIERKKESDKKRYHSNPDKVQRKLYSYKNCYIFDRLGIRWNDATQGAKICTDGCPLPVCHYECEGGLTDIEKLICDMAIAGFKANPIIWKNKEGKWK